MAKSRERIIRKYGASRETSREVRLATDGFKNVARAAKRTTEPIGITRVTLQAEFSLNFYLSSIKQRFEVNVIIKMSFQVNLTRSRLLQRGLFGRRVRALKSLSSFL